MERPDRPHEGSPQDTNTPSTGNRYLLARLRDPDPVVRARFAEAVGIARASVGIPYLLNAVVSDPEARVRDAARAALDVLQLPRAASCASQGGICTPVATPSTALRDESEAIFALFNEYLANRLTPPHKPGQADLICPVTAFLSVWDNHPADDLDDIEYAALGAVRSIAGFLGVPNSSATVKFLSFQGAWKSVREYEVLIAGRDEKEA